VKIAGLNISPGSRVHLAICTSKVINLLLNGKKKIETRFSKNKTMTYNRIDPTNIKDMERVVGMLIHNPDRGKEVFNALTKEFKKKEKKAKKE